MKKFFIVGCPRSGTTLLQQALNRHSQVVIPPETKFFVDFFGHTRLGQLQYLRRINADLQIDLPIPPRRVRSVEDAVGLYEQMARLYLERLGRTDITYFGEKTPDHLLYIRQLHRLFPDAKILLLYRDGRDVALSLTKVPWSPPDLYVNFAIWLRYYRWQRWVEGNSAFEVLCVKYENFVSNPESELRRIMEFLQVPYESHMVEGHGNRDGVPTWEYAWKSLALEKITPSRIGTWQTDLPTDHLKNLERWGGHALQSLGYELATHGPHHLPWTFFVRLHWRHSVWRARCAHRLVAQELLGQPLRISNDKRCI